MLYAWLTVLRRLPRLRVLGFESRFEDKSGADYVKATNALEKKLQQELPNCKVGPLR